MDFTEALGLLVPVIITFIGTLSYVLKKVLSIFDKQLDRANKSLESMTHTYAELTIEMREGNRLQKEAIKRLDSHISDTMIHLGSADIETLAELKNE